MKKQLPDEQRRVKIRAYYWANRERKRKINQKWRDTHRAELHERQRIHRMNNLEKYKEKDARYYLHHKYEINLRSKKYRESHRKERIEYDKDYYQENREKRISQVQIYYHLNKTHLLANHQEYFQLHREQVYLKRREWIVRIGINYQRAVMLHRRIVNALKRYIVLKRRKSFKLDRILGYSIEDLKIHIQHQFSVQMNWKNWGIHWEIDHRIPIIWFVDENNKSFDFKKCFALENLRPLEIYKNNHKCSRFAEPTIMQSINMHNQQ